MIKPEDIVIIGAGISGLYISSMISKPLVLEKSQYVGGRIRTRYSHKGVVEYEEGPWRIALEHKRVRSLIDDLGLTTSPLNSSLVEQTNLVTPVSPDVIYNEHCKTQASQSAWARNAIANDPETADRIDRSSGYVGIQKMASGSNSYDAEDSKDYQKKYLVVNEGLSEMAVRLASRTRNNGGEIRLGTDVTNIRRERGLYILEVTQRTGHNSYKNYEIRSRRVIACVPPRFMQKWDISTPHLLPILPLVSPLPLVHVYAKADYKSRDGSPILKPKYDPTLGFHLITKGICSQIVSPMYAAAQPEKEPSDLFTMVAYSGGEQANTLRNLNLCNLEKFESLVTHELNKAMEDAHAFEHTGTVLSLHDIRLHYWECALHTWNPLWGLTIEEAMERVTEPHPICLPGFYIAGEAFSNIQGWIEGALQTAEIVINRLNTAKSSPTHHHLPARYVLFDHRIIDLHGWAKRHPGGSKPLHNHIGEDIVDLLVTNKHPDYAYGILFCLQKGFAKKELKRSRIRK